MGSLNIIHLSDLHIDSRSHADTVPMTEALCVKLNAYRKEKNIDCFDLLIVSGDLVNRGSDSYDLVGARLDQIRLAAGIGEKGVFVVPGNHDVDRNKCYSTYYDSCVEKLTSEPNRFYDVERDQATKGILIPPFEKYLNFEKSLPLMLSSESFRLPGFSRNKIVIDGLTINLCGLNTALVAGPNDSLPNGKPKDDNDIKNRCCGYDYLSEMLDNTENELNCIFWLKLNTHSDRI